MSMSEVKKLQKQTEASKRRVQKRRDVQDERNAGSYSNGKSAYLDENEYPRDDIEIPVWFKNLSRAWQSNIAMGQQRRAAKKQKENQSLLDEFGTAQEALDDPNRWLEYAQGRRRPVGRPRMRLEDRKKQPKKRSQQMKELLEEYGISLIPDPDDQFEYPSLSGFEGWVMTPNGRVKYYSESTISVHRFLQDHDLIPM